jgi:hypothetical protein
MLGYVTYNELIYILIKKKKHAPRFFLSIEIALPRGFLIKGVNVSSGKKQVSPST